VANSKEINQELQSLSTFRLLVDTYEEIAATRMRRIRVSVVKSRDFIAELGGIMEELKASYKRQVEQLTKHKKHSSSGIQFRKQNGKTIALLLSANTGLYGAILQATVTSFIEYVNKHDCDVVIVGRYGKTAFENRNPGKQFTFFDFPDQRFRPEDMKQILATILDYSNIYVFHGQFVSIIKQEPKMTTISTETTEGEEHLRAVKEAKPTNKFIFEPSLEKILVFFEEEIFAALFEQAIHESELAKFASRMVTLDKASQNIKDRVKKVEFMKRLTNHRTMNKKQQDSLSSMLLWNK